MSMINCDMCNNLIDLDWHEGEWDIEDRDGEYYDFVCADCFCNCDEFNGETTFTEVKELYKSGQVDLVTFMEMQTKTIEYKNLKENNNGSTKT